VKKGPRFRGGVPCARARLRHAGEPACRFRRAGAIDREEARRETAGPSSRPVLGPCPAISRIHFRFQTGATVETLLHARAEPNVADPSVMQNPRGRRRIVRPAAEMKRAQASTRCAHINPIESAPRGGRERESDGAVREDPVDPDYPKTHFLLGYHLAEGKVDEAVASFARAALPQHSPNTRRPRAPRTNRFHQVHQHDQKMNESNSETESGRHSPRTSGCCRPEKGRSLRSLTHCRCHRTTTVA
jgi:hypothetical protein